MKNIRNIPGHNVQDPAILHNLEYNDAAGSKKVSEVGRHLIPVPYINSGSLAFKTDLSAAAQALPQPGLCLAIYNNSASLGSVTLGEDGTITSLAPGVTDGSGHVGVPCKPNDWTYVACGSQQWAITSASTLLVFIIDDNTTVKTEVK